MSFASQYFYNFKEIQIAGMQLPKKKHMHGDAK